MTLTVAQLTKAQVSALKYSLINDGTGNWIFNSTNSNMFKRLEKIGLLKINNLRQRCLTDLAKKLHAELGFSGLEQ